MAETQHRVCVYHGEALAAYGFGEGHPFGPDRLEAFWKEARRQGLDKQVCQCTPVQTTQSVIEYFHTAEYVERVKRFSVDGGGFLDMGDTPAFKGMFEATSTVIGSVLDGIERILQGSCHHVFVPIAGLHHARRDGAAGFCVFNDCGVAIEALRRLHGIQRVLYVDIDAHHGDGVFYGFESDPLLFFADLHEDGRYLYPGTGAADETGRGEAKDTKLNIPMPPGADDEAFLQAWDRVEAYVSKVQPEFILLQCGADSVAGDPITHMAYSEHSHSHAARRLSQLAEEHCQGRLLAMGGGGYNRQNLARAWTAVVRGLLNPSASD